MINDLVISSKKLVDNRSLDTIGNKRPLSQNSVKKSYEKKRSAKALTKASMYRLFGVKSSINDDYKQAYMCNEYLFQNGQKITSNYCKKKCCTVCNRIRSAQNLYKYGPRILELKNQHMVVLTKVNVFKDQLEDEVDSMYKSLVRIKKNMYQTYKIRINGFRSFECTYSKEKGFNPHFNFIVDGEDKAKLLLKLWLKQFPDTASNKGQKITKAYGGKKGLLELFKYISKPVTKGYYSSIAYDEIMRSIKMHRVTEPLGSIRGRLEKDNSDVSELDINDLESQFIDFKGDRIEVWKYIDELYDYVSPDGELLLGTPLDKKTLNAIDSIDNCTDKITTDKIQIDDIFSSHRKKNCKPIF